MKILYGIQGTGNGHLSRAKSILPLLSQSHEVDVLLSGHSVEVNPGFPVKYRFNGLGFSFGENGGIDYLDTVMNLHPAWFIRDVQKLPVHNYDLIISDFEPVTSWSAFFAGMPVTGLSHQAAFLSPNTPRSTSGKLLGEFIFRNYAPVDHPIGFHFEPYDDFILTPIIRDQIRSLSPIDGGHITVYLPAYSHHFLSRIFKKLDLEVHIFSKKCNRTIRDGNILIRPVSGEKYLQSLEQAAAVICGAGFEAPSEVLFLGKRLICIPMKDQYEQKCNAEALQKMGVFTANSLHGDFLKTVENRLNQPAPAPIDYPDITDQVIDRIFDSVTVSEFNLR